MRVVSLIASSTEIVCALGFESLLVGRSHECDYPGTVSRLPACTEPKFRVDGSSLEIDERVRAIVREGLSVYRVFPERLDALKPDLIITQTQCEVCAVSLRDVEQAVCHIVGSRPRIVSLHPSRLSDVWADIERVAEALGAPERGRALVARLTAEMRAISDRARAAATLPMPRIAFIEWIEPLMLGGHWMPELIELAGAVDAFGAEAGGRSPTVTWEDFKRADPDAIVVAPCGFDRERTLREMPALEGKPHWRELRAVREGRVTVADGNAYFNRPGPRLVESLEILAGA